ncbi:MAG: arsenate reductase (glutaredoxin) [Oligoflexia bacterium]|nr:arsenate reductase (glutaredoxin) [Oligoflexia bacterium]
MSWKYYHNSRCSKSRQGLEYLQGKGIELEVVEYMKAPVDENELVSLFKLLENDSNYFIRKKEDAFKALTNTDLTYEAWAKEVNKNPKLLERPVLSNGKKAIIGRPTENFDQIL